MNTEILIAGAGPTGLMLAGELALAGIEVILLERRASQDLVGSRAGGLHARTIELLDQRGIADRFLAEGQVAQVAFFGGTVLDLGDFPTRHPYGLALWQNRIEHILAGWVAELGVPVQRASEVTGFTQDETGVTVALAGGRSLRARYLVGCDGGRSIVRKAAGIDFPGWDPTMSFLIAEAELAEAPACGLRSDAIGLHGITPLGPDGAVRIVLTERQLGPAADPTLAELREALIAVYGTDYGLRSARWLSRFTDMARQAAAYRQGRMLLAGDAAHIHNPVGGQGLNIGVQDAVNLGWKLAQVVRGPVPESLLDSYHAERHPVAARVLRTTLAQIALRRTDERSRALGDVVAELAALDEPRKRLGAMMAGLDIRYDLGFGHPLLGRRMPDLDLVTAAGPIRVYSLLRRARPLLLDFGAGVEITPWADRVRRVEADCAGAWVLPVLGTVSPPGAVLIRPDGYVAWVGVDASDGLAAALTRWFGNSDGKPDVMAGLEEA